MEHCILVCIASGNERMDTKKDHNTMHLMKNEDSCHATLGGWINYSNQEARAGSRSRRKYGNGDTACFVLAHMPQS